MEKFLDKLSLGLIFRQLFCGLIFLTSYYYSGHPSQNPFRLFEQYKEHLMALTAAAFVIGSVIYSLHRAITNPLFELFRWKLATNIKEERWWLLLTHKQLVQNTVLRWRLDSRLKKPSQNFHDWGDYVQLLYTTSFSIWLGSIAWFLVSAHSDEWNVNWIVFWNGLLILVVGFYNDVRKYIYECELYQYSRVRNNPSIPDLSDLALLDWDRNDRTDGK